MLVDLVESITIDFSQEKLYRVHIPTLKESENLLELFVVCVVELLLLGDPPRARSAEKCYRM